jgi:hypothetical protein
MAVRFRTAAVISCALIALTAMRLPALAAQAQPGASELGAGTILARAKAAAGGEALGRVRSLQMDARVTLAGISGTGRAYIDCVDGRFAQFLELGPLSGGNGFDGKQPWTQDPTGDAWPLGDYVSTRSAISNAYLMSWSFWFPHRRPGTVSYLGTTTAGGHSYLTLRANPVGGFPVDIMIDPQTYFIQREVIRVPGGRDVTTSFADFRQVGDVVLPFSNDTNEEGNEIVLQAVRVELNARVASQLAMPSIPITDASIAGGTSTTIPFSLINNHLYVQVRLDGKGPFRFIFDSGGQNVVTPEVAAQLGRSVAGALRVSGAGAASASTGFAWIPSLQIGNATLRHQSFAVLPIGRIMQAVEGEKIDGIIGVEVFRRFITTIDYQHGRITFTRGAQPKIAGTAIPFVYDQSVPLVAGAAGGLTGHFIIDTGNRSSLVFYAPFVAQHHLLEEYPSDVRGIAGFGLGGPSMGQLIRVKRFTIGTVSVADPVAILSLDKAGALTEPGTAGNIGGGTLKRFTVTFAYQRRLMYLAPNAWYRDPGAHDRSGLFLIQTSKGIKVIDALTGTPAFAAGLKAGDIITDVDGTAALTVGLLKLRAELCARAGTTITLGVTSGETAKKVTLTLRDYV